MTTTTHELPRFDLQTALDVAGAARAAYMKRDEAQAEMIERWHADEFTFFNSDDTQAFVAATEETIIVAFRGTETDSVGDIVTDMTLDRMKGPLGGEVHVGFYDALSNVWCDLDDEVRRLQSSRPRKLFVGGHSLGAALACLAAARWLELRRPVHGHYGFGQPRVGDRAFSLNFDFMFKPYSHRFVNHADIITRIPPRALGYRHTGTFKYFGKEGEFLEGINWWRAFMTRWHGRLENIFEWCGHGVSDHKMDSYYDHIENALASTRKPTMPEEPRVYSTTVQFEQATFSSLLKPRRRVA